MTTKTFLTTIFLSKVKHVKTLNVQCIINTSHSHHNICLQGGIIVETFLEKTVTLIPKKHIFVQYRGGINRDYFNTLKIINRPSLYFVVSQNMRESKIISERRRLESFLEILASAYGPSGGFKSQQSQQSQQLLTGPPKI